MPKFEEMEKVKHIVSGGIYRIRRIPDHRKLEYKREPFYEYESMHSGDVWLRCKSEMEDGRFISLDLEAALNSLSDDT